jgi:hypothetical protein
LYFHAFERRTPGVLYSAGLRTSEACISKGSVHLERETPLPVNKVTWQQVGHVTEPGRYMFRFGWLTIVADDLAIWRQFPDASFTLVQTLAPPMTAEAETAETPSAETDEFHLGAFELHVSSDAGWHSPQMPDEPALESQSVA